MSSLSNPARIEAGTVAAFGMDTPPSGWLVADGAAISRLLYSALFNKIGDTFGPGDGATTFNIPDLRGEFLRGTDAQRGVDPGRVFGSSQSDEFRSHTHSLTFSGGSGNQFDPYLQTGSYLKTSRTTDSAGGSETRPRNVALQFCIKF